MKKVEMLYWIAANKLLTFLGVALFAFFVATIALAVENNDNAAALQSCKDRLYAATTTPTTVPPAETTQAPAPATTLTPEATTTTTEEPTTTNENTAAGRKRRSAEGKSWRQMG
ncbi:hypothetical protein CpipJ_CPIJ000657 [Culex quinquefasciatus]|uniref:Uncharacterized protein n=1 Tax=Culex quinquefasciatus TaxID=7176 RepID=B0W136_CULQU|nr:hypothetical protein CpipJ_CPIJ000657 [Culex quinquefasciatus]|eukprot:XP_001842420.1 hypothetical protein CpipJ_CPIJ000657 [Culex quinquefasciatus]